MAPMRLGGAVNTILRKNFNGFEANATLDHASGVNNPSVNLAWGKSWERGSVSLVGELTRSSASCWGCSASPGL